jgi:hypothetical protein
MNLNVIELRQPKSDDNIDDNQKDFARFFTTSALPQTAYQSDLWQGTTSKKANGIQEVVGSIPIVSTRNT